MLDLAILAVVMVAGGLMTLPRIARAQLWRATITPFASIIGGGFLVLGPILIVNYGAYAAMVMIALCVVAYAFGEAIRFSIERIDAAAPRSVLAEGIERVASAVLASAYVISVAYCLNLFGAFTPPCKGWQRGVRSPGSFRSRCIIRMRNSLRSGGNWRRSA